ncbi:hypothetical protein [Kitasatospora sp. NPDC101183]|uniref:hypothetical protein n=1 Tax=Kitasatospora sp. NPDC101183 TaxID=3364100 RepID=UPI00381BB3A5
MGTDIHGAVEYRRTHGHAWNEPASWQVAIDLEALHDERNYDAFDCLFGVRNHAGFRPLAPDRGLPEGASAEVRADIERWRSYESLDSVTWIGWEEIAAVDWDEPAERADRRVTIYRRGADATWVRTGKALLRERAWRPDGEEWTEGREWEEGELLHRIERMTRREAVRPDGAWAPVFTVMRTLAGLHGEGNVRLTVWFDS